MAAFRAFVGVPVGPLPGLVRLLEGLDASGADLKTTLPEKLHVTLSFLGDVPEDATPVLAAALDSAAAGRPAFTIKLRGVGAFPHARRPRVVWVGLEDPRALVDLALATRARLDATGFPGDGKDFRAHVTLARVRSERGLDGAVRFLRDHGRDDAGEVEVRDVRLYRSTLGTGGAQHEVLHVAPLEA